MDNNQNNRPPIVRTNWLDGLAPTSQDFIDEQNGIIQRIDYVVSDFHGSGVLQNHPILLPPILDTSTPLSSNISFNVIGAGNYDGKGIFIDRQPVDDIYGDQLMITLNDVIIPLYKPTKVMILGKIYDPNFQQGITILETIIFNKPGSKATFNYFKEVVAIFFNNFSGGHGRTALLTSSQESINIIDGSGKIVIREVGPLQTLEHGLVLKQTDQPNLDVRDFITSTITRTFNDELNVVVATAQNTNISISANDLNFLPLNTSGIATKPFLDSTTNGVIYGQKIFLSTNNIQQVSFALSLDNDAYGWSGEIVIGIRPLQTKSINQFANKIDLDPDVNILFEASYTQDDLFNAGYVLTKIPQEIKFNFLNSALAQSGAILRENQYYVITIKRRADISIGKIFIETGLKELVNSKFTIFNPTTTAWTDDIQTDMWFKIFSSAIRISSGVAYTTQGTMITIQKTAVSNDGSIISSITGPYSLAVIDSVASDNVVVLEQSVDFQLKSTHPRTGNLIFKRIVDKAKIAILDANDFINLAESSTIAPIVLATINDLNNKINTSFNGTITLPGQITKNTITLFNTNISDQLLSINNVLIPNIASSGVKYRIVEAKTTTQYLGDFNNDKIFTAFDLVEQANIQDTFSAQSTNTLTNTAFDPYSVFDARSRDAISFGKETITDFVISDIDESLTIDSNDAARLQYLTTTLPAFVSPTPTSISIQTLTLENITNTNTPILVAQITNLDGYVHGVFPDKVAFTAISVEDMRSMSIGDTIKLSADGYFATPAYTATITDFIQRNDLMIETRFGSNVLPAIGTSYVLSFYTQNPVFNNKLGVFGEIATEVLELVAPGINLLSANIMAGDKVRITDDTLIPTRDNLYTISQVVDAITFRVSAPTLPITNGVSNAYVEFFATDSTTDKLSDTAIVQFVVNGINLITSGIEPGDKVHITGDTAGVSRNGLYTIARVISATIFTTKPPGSPFVAETGNATFEFRDSADIIVKIAPSAVIGAITKNGPTPHLVVGMESLAPAQLPNGADTIFEFSLTHIPITGIVNVHWITSGITKTMIFNSAPVEITGDGNPNDSSINRITGEILLDTFLPPDANTDITIDYRIAPIVTLKHCYPTIVNPVSIFQTDIEFKVPFINPTPGIDITGIAGAPYVIIQTNNADPPDIVTDGSNNVVAGAVMVNTINPLHSVTLPSRNVVLKVVNANGNPPNIVDGYYWMNVYSGTSINLPAVQKEFLSNVLNTSSPIHWAIRKNNFEWLDCNMIIKDWRRFLPAAFVSSNSEDYSTKNEMWIPSDLYIGAGEIFGRNGKPYHGDLEITSINLNLPVTALLSNSINIYNNLIATWPSTPGITRGGRLALKFSDGTWVGGDDISLNTALTKNQVRMNVSIGSIYLDGYKVTGATTYQDLDQVITDLRYEIRNGLFLDHNSGILYFHVENIKAIIANEPILQTTICRVVIDVALKKAGFNNPVVSVNATDVLRLFTNSVSIIPVTKYSISGEIISGFTVGKTTDNPNG